jgi:archaemetzincin
MSSKEHTLVISPIGDLDAGGELLESLGKELRKLFGYPTEIRPLIEEKDLWLDPVRKQYHSTPILETLAVISPREAVKVLAITKVDLFIPILTHVYGEAQLGGKACILSTYRFNEEPSHGRSTETFYCRLLKEAVHELGHTFNLRHCTDSTCAMHYCRSVKEVDRKSNRFCRYCTVLLSDEMKKLAKGTPVVSKQ